MQFIFTILQKIVGGLSSSKAVKEAYAETLSHHHNFWIRKGFEWGLKATPSNAVILGRLGTDTVRHDSSLFLTRNDVYIHIYIAASDHRSNGYVHKYCSSCL